MPDPASADPVTDPLLAACEVIDYGDPEVRALSARLRMEGDPVATARAMFRWVRDEVAHSGDVPGGPATLRASEVLRARTGFCYAKSHLLVALLRAAGVRAGLCYQRLHQAGPGSPLTLHGMVAVDLGDGVLQRIDPRGNRPGVDARFAVGQEQLAYQVVHPQECDLPGVFARPVAAVADALGAAAAAQEVEFPDVPPSQWPSKVALDWGAST